MKLQSHNSNTGFEFLTLLLTVLSGTLSVRGAPGNAWILTVTCPQNLGHPRPPGNVDRKIILKDGVKERPRSSGLWTESSPQVCLTCLKQCEKSNSRMSVFSSRRLNFKKFRSSISKLGDLD